MARPKKTFAIDDINKIAAGLEKVPEKPRNLTENEVLESLQPQIKSLRKKGYEWREIKQILSERGLKVTLSALSGRVSRKQKISRDGEKNDDASM